MNLLTETVDINELNRLRILFHLNGIPIFIGNEDSARNFLIGHPASNYGIFVIYEEQFNDARQLLDDENHVVENQIDMDKHTQDIAQLQPSTRDQLFNAVMTIAIVVVIVIIGFIWLMVTIRA